MCERTNPARLRSARSRLRTRLRATSRRTSWNDLHVGRGHDESPAPLPDEAHLLDDLRLEVPREDEEEVRLTAPHVIRLADRDVCSREVSPLLVRVEIDGEVDEVGPDAAVVEQRVSLGRRSVADDALPRVLRIDEEGQYPSLCPACFLAEGRIGLDICEAGRALALADNANRVGRNAVASDKEAQRPSVCRKLVHIDDLEPVVLED